jgi:hypothetical protein
LANQVQKAVAPPAVFADRKHPGLSLLDIPLEIRQMIYRLVFLTQKTLDMSLDPTPRLRPPEDTWGSRNRFALLGTCRQLYHDGAVLAYGDNIFRIERGLHRDLYIPKAPGMPFHQIHYLKLQYPEFFGPCTWDLGHIWEHWLQDALYVTSRFPNLKHLVLQVSYNGSDSLNRNDLESWQPLFRGKMNSRRFTKRVKRVVMSLVQINGKRMPECVRIHVTNIIDFFWGGHNIHAINDAIPLAFGKCRSVEDFVALNPSWRAETD